MKTGKKVLSLLLVFLMLFALCGGVMADEGKDIIVLYTNDVHCGIDYETDDDGGVSQIGYAGVASYKNEMLAQTEYVTLVDAGDAIQGGPIGTLSKGSYIVDIMNKSGYALAVPGNHEFDYGMDNFLKLANEAAEYNYVCCNFLDLKTGKPVFDAYKMVSYGSTKVAYVGIDTPESFTKSTPTYFQDANGKYIYSFCQGNNGKDLYDVVQKAIDAAKAEGADFVIAVGHCGIDEQSAPWRSTDIIANVTGLDAFIDGHSHSTIPSQKVSDKAGETVLLSSTGTKTAAIGKLVIKADGSLSTELITGYGKQDETVAAFIADINAEFKEVLSQVVAKSDVALTTKAADGTRLVRSGETNLGDLCADAYRVMLGADVAFVNGGGIRADIASGEITYEDIINVHPFGNEACLVEATGQQILDALEMGARVCPEENGGFLQVSGLTFTIDTTIPSSVVLNDEKEFVKVDGEYRVKDVLIGGQPIQLDKTYTLASHNYMLKNGGDGFVMFKNNKVLKDCVLIDNQVLINYIVEELNGVVPKDYAEPQGRISLIKMPFSDVVVTEWYCPYVLSAYEKGLMDGMGGGKFAPATEMTRAMLVTMLYRLEESPAVTGKVSDVFTDCTDGVWYADAVLWASQNGIVNGLTPTTFGPTATLTRQQMATILYNYAVMNGATAVTEPKLTFTDAAEVSDWALDGVYFCTAQGIMNGVSETVFDPDGTANRAMGATVLDRIAA